MGRMSKVHVVLQWGHGRWSRGRVLESVYQRIHYWGFNGATADGAVEESAGSRQRYRHGSASMGPRPMEPWKKASTSALGSRCFRFNGATADGAVEERRQARARIKEQYASMGPRPMEPWKSTGSIRTRLNRERLQWGHGRWSRGRVGRSCNLQADSVRLQWGQGRWSRGRELRAAEQEHSQERFNGATADGAVEELAAPVAAGSVAPASMGPRPMEP